MKKITVLIVSGTKMGLDVAKFLASKDYGIYIMSSFEKREMLVSDAVEYITGQNIKVDGGIIRSV